ncbi:MAG: LysE family transporter, partial [Sulfitobacter sp.]|nr:LysE family transporter [Sulfitobacter sp.]
ALLGLESVFALFPWAYASLKTAGALYLMWLAYQTWCRARDAVTEAAPRPGRNFGAGFLVNLGNPKSMLFAAAVIIVVFPQGLAGSQIALIALNHLLLEVAFYGLLVALLGAPLARTRYLRLKPLFDRIAATLLGALGLRLLLER